MLDIGSQNRKQKSWWKKQITHVTLFKLIDPICFRKLLKMHESKYEPMEKTDAEKIMEEILSMQAGLNPDQQVKYGFL